MSADYTQAQLSVTSSQWQARPGRVITPMGVALALSLLGDATLYTVLPTHTVDAGIALGSVGIMLGVNRAVRLLLNTPVGMAYDRWPRRWLFLPAAFLGVLSTVIYALSADFVTLLVGRLLWGLAWSGLWVGGQKITLDVARLDNRGKLMGWTQGWFFLGGALSFLLGGLLTDLLSYRGALWIGAGLSAVGFLGAVMFLPESRPIGKERVASPGSRPVRFSQMLPELRGGGWLALYAYAVLRFCTAGVVAATLGLYVAQQLGSQIDMGIMVLGAATLTGVLLGIRPLASLVAAPWAGALSDRRGRYAVLRWGALLGAVGFGLLSLGSLEAIVTSGLVAALSMGMLSPAASALVGDISPARSQGRGLGWLATAGDLGSALGPIVAYALLSWMGLGTIYLLCLGLMLSVWAASLLPTNLAPLPKPAD